MTNPHICVDYAALTREYEQVSSDRDRPMARAHQRS